MTTQGFDRLRPRTPRPEPAAVPVAHDAEGKRALFSSGTDDRPGAGSIAIECSRCEACTVLSPVAALLVSLPSLHFGFVLGRGDRESQIGLVRRRYPSVMRCPACGKAAWVRVTVRV